MESIDLPPVDEYVDSLLQEEENKNRRKTDLLTSKDILKYFRHKTFRPGQKEAILEAQEAFKSGKKFVISELPTGTGKSDIALTLALAAVNGEAYGYDYLEEMVADAIFEVSNPGSGEFSEKYGELPLALFENTSHTFHNKLILSMNQPQSYIVTSQKPLQTQYLKEFGYRAKGADKDSTEHIYDIRGKNNYYCQNPKSQHEDDCASNKRSCIHRGTVDCSYVYERLKAQYHPIASTNSSFYAVGTTNWLKRELSVIDECHNTPDDILNITSFTISDAMLESCSLIDHYFDENVKYKEGQTEAIATGKFIHWVETLCPVLEGHLEFLRDKVIYADGDEEMMDKLEDLLGKAYRFLETTESTEWIVEAVHSFGNRKFVARPLDSGYFARGLFLKQSIRTAMQSATITNVKKFAEDMGLRPEEYAFIQKPSPFPLHNRPVFNMNTVKMGYKDLDDSLPSLCAMIQRIIDCYPVHKGIIHCQTYKLQQEITKRLRSLDRIICPGPGQREQAIAEHIRTDKPTVLISPSMTEGIDLKGELARFSIVCKLPYPYLGDRRIKIKTDRDPDWYQYQTAKTLVQSVGRGVRSESDWCHTYILDKGFNYFMKKAPLPPDFVNSVASESMGEKILNQVKQKYSR